MRQIFFFFAPYTLHSIRPPKPLQSPQNCRDAELGWLRGARQIYLTMMVRHKKQSTFMHIIATALTVVETITSGHPTFISRLGMAYLSKHQHYAARHQSTRHNSPPWRNGSRWVALGCLRHRFISSTSHPSSRRPRRPVACRPLRGSVVTSTQIFIK